MIKIIGITEQQILLRIKDNKSNLTDLSTEFNLSERSIRYKLKNLNQFFNDEKIQLLIEVKSKNILVNGDLDEILNKKINLESKNYIFSQEERIEILKAELLFSKVKFNQESVTNKLDISSSTFKKDWKLLRKEFKDQGVDIKNSKYTTELSCSEELYRQLLLKYIIRYQVNSKELNAIGIVIKEIINQYFKDIELKSIIEFLNITFDLLGKSISDEAFEILKYYIALIILRNKNNHYCSTTIKNQNFLLNTLEYKLLKEQIVYLEKSQDFTLKESELYILTEYILGSHSYNPKYSFYENWIKIENIINLIIKSVGKEYKADLSKDLILFEGILNHIKPMIYRVRRGIKLENSIQKELKKEEPILFKNIKKNIFYLEDFIEKKLDDDEISYLVIFFKLSLQRLEKKTIKKVIIVCSFGYGVSRILEAKLKETFNIEIVDVLPMNKLNNYSLEQKSIDLIITTVNLGDFLTEIPILKVEPFLNDKNLRSLEEMGLKKLSLDVSLESLFKIIEKHCKIENEGDLKKEIFSLFGRNHIDSKLNKNGDFTTFLPKENIEILDSSCCWQDAIQKAGKILIEKGYINSKYIQKSIDIIEEQGPYMLIGKGILLPHSDSHESVKKTGYSLLKLNNPVEIVEDDQIYKIENIFFLASLDGSEHRNSLLVLKEMIDKYDLYSILKNSNSADEIYKKISKVENKIKF